MARLKCSCLLIARNYIPLLAWMIRRSVFSSRCWQFANVGLTYIAGILLKWTSFEASQWTKILRLMHISVVFYLKPDKEIAAILKVNSCNCDVLLPRHAFQHMRGLHVVEYNTVVCNSCVIHLIALLGSVQRNFTIRIPSIANLTYAERLAVLDLERWNWEDSFDFIFY